MIKTNSNDSITIKMDFLDYPTLVDLHIGNVSIVDYAISLLKHRDAYAGTNAYELYLRNTNEIVSMLNNTITSFRVAMENNSNNHCILEHGEFCSDKINEIFGVDDEYIHKKTSLSDEKERLIDYARDIFIMLNDHTKSIRNTYRKELSYIRDGLGCVAALISQKIILSPDASHDLSCFVADYEYRLYETWLNTTIFPKYVCIRHYVFTALDYNLRISS